MNLTTKDQMEDQKKRNIEIIPKRVAIAGGKI